MSAGEAASSGRHGRRARKLLQLPLLRAHRGLAFVHARERALLSGAP